MHVWTRSRTDRPAQRARRAILVAALLLPILPAAVLIAPSPARADTTPAWAQPVAAPIGRSGAAIAFDTSTNQLIMFGGFDGNSSEPQFGYLNDTWIWAGGTWIQQFPATSPPVRSGASMAWDVATGQLILFGGVNGSAPTLQDTWNWNGSNWVQLSPTQIPSPRYDAAMEFASGTGLVLFGGNDGSNNSLPDTWTWDGSQWNPLAPSPAPSPRWGAGMAQSPGGGSVFLLNGTASASNAPITDGWTFDGTNWTLQGISPAARVYPAWAFDPKTGTDVLFGGEGTGNSNLGDTWTWNGTSWSQQSPTASPCGRSGASMAYDGATGQMVLFGGFGCGGRMNDTWTWDGTTWTQANVMPTPRDGASMALDEATGQLVMFGGSHSGNGLTDTWIWNGTAWNQVFPAHTPPIRGEAAMTYDSAHGVIVMFGGCGVTGLNDTWTWNGSDWTQLSPATSPPARCRAAMAFDPALNQTVLFGGQLPGGGGTFGDTWTWDGTNWTQRTPATSPTSREGVDMAYDAARNQLVLFGGDDLNNLYPNETWIWDGANWNQQSTVSSPPGRSDFAMTYDQAAGVVVLFGGYSCCSAGTGTKGDTWTWDGSTWSQQITPVSPPARLYVTGAPDPSTGQPVIFGGINNLGDTWSFTLTGVNAFFSADTPTISSIQSVPEANLPVGSTERAAPSNGSGNAASAPLHSIPLHSIALGAAPLHSIPLHSIPLHSIALANQLLSSVLLSNLPISYPPGCTGTACTGWSGVLAGTKWAIAPLESVSLADVLGDPVASARFESVSLSGLDVQSSPLASIPLASIALAGTPLHSIPLSASDTTDSARVQDWCNQLSSLGFSCQNQFGIDPNNPSTAEHVDILALALAGVPLHSIPLHSIPLASIDLTSSPLHSIPLHSIAVDSTPLHSIPLHSIPLHSIPLASIPLHSIGGLSTVVDCTKVDCSPTTTATLSDAEAAGAILPTAMLGDIENLDAAALSAVPLHSINMATSPLHSIPLHSIDVNSSPLHSIPLHSIPLHSIPLASIPLHSIGNLSAVVNCAQVDCSPTTTATLGDAETAGAISLSATLGDLEQVDAGVLATYPLHSINMTTSPLHSIPLHSIDNLNGVVDCTKVDCSATSSATLGDAAAAGALLPTSTLADLGLFLSATLGDISPGFGPTSPTLADLPGFLGTTLGELMAGINPNSPDFPTLTLADLLTGIAPPTSYPWDKVSLSSLPLAQAATQVPETYTAEVAVPGQLTTIATATLTIPPSFTWVPGSLTIDGATCTVNPCSPASGSNTLTINVPSARGLHVFVFKALPGTSTGIVHASVRAVSGSHSSTATADVSVIDSREPDNTPAKASPLLTGTLNLSRISSVGDVDFWSIHVNQGDELALNLSNLPANYDLALFSPDSIKIQGSPDQMLDPVTDTQPSISPSPEPLPGAGDVAQTPPAGFQTYAVSDDRDAKNGQTIQTPPLDAGTYLVQVSGYNGAFSQEPYVLRATVLPTGVATTCAAIHYPNPMPAVGTSDPIPGNVNTLFLVNTQRLAAAYGSPSEQNVWNTLGTLSGDSADGVIGARVALDSIPAVQSAYGAWNDNAGANPCSVPAANAVVSSIAAQVDKLRAANPTIRNVVVVGADDQIPFARLADGATQSNERDYASSTFPGESNVLATTLGQGYFLSDDPLTAVRPLQVGSATLYSPETGVGRLVETPTQIINAVNRFITSHGVLNASSGLSTGYSFLSSGAQLVQANLAKVSSRTVAALIGDSWTRSDLNNALTAGSPGLDSLNAHFDFGRSLPAVGDTTGNQSDLFTTSDIRNAAPNTYTGRLLFSMGCHSGLAVNSAEVAASGVATPVDDWSKTFADVGALWVANTGFGYGDDKVVAYSANLMAGFANNLDGSQSVGAALTNAKQSYMADGTLLSAYDLKALMESTFYGLPMYRLNSTPPTPPAPPTPPTTQTDPITGLTTAPVSFSLSVGNTSGSNLQSEPGANGTSYYQYNGPNGAQIQTIESRPIEPLVTSDVTQPSATAPGDLRLVAHGALITQAGSVDFPGSKAAVTQVVEDSGATAVPPNPALDAYPNQIQRLATLHQLNPNGSQGSRQQLDLMVGQFIPDPAHPGVGDQRLFNSLTATVLYTDPSNNNFTPASIVADSAYVNGSRVDFTTLANDNSAITRVLVLYTDATSPGTWVPLDLASNDGVHWSGSGASTPSGKIAYFVQAVDANGNVAVASNKGIDFPALTVPAPTGGVSVTLPGAPASGYYSSDVPVTISGGDDLRYSLDGGPFTSVNSGNQVTVTGDGAHTLTAVDTTGATATQEFAIDESPPVISAAVNPGAGPGNSVTPGSVVSIAATDAGSGVKSITTSTSGSQTSGPTTTNGSSTTVTLSNPGSVTVNITGVDNAGNVSPTRTLTFSVAKYGQTITITSNPPNPARYGGQYTLTATGGGSGNPVTFSIDPASGSGVCSVSGSTVSFTKVGTCLIDANQAGNSSFGDAPTVQQSVSVLPAPLTVTASSPSVVYGAGVPAITPTYGGLVNGDTKPATPASCSTTASNSSKVGTYPSTCSGAADPNYTITYASGTVTITPADLTITASSPSYKFGSSPPPITPGYTGLVNGDTAPATPPTCTTSATSSSPVGSYPSTCSGASDPNYRISYVGGTVTVTAASLTITASSPTVTYGSTVPAITPNYSGLKNGATAPQTPPTCTTSATSSSPVGSYVSSCSGASDPNYTIAYVNGTVTVVPAQLTITASSPTVTYGSTVPAITPNYSGLNNGATAPRTPPTCTTSATSASNAGTYSSSCSGASDSNYTISYVNGTVTIQKAPLAVVVTGSQTYGGSSKAFAVGAYNGFVNGQNSSVLSGSLTGCVTSTSASANATTSGHPYTGTISGCGGFSSPNYSISYVDGGFAVNKANLTVTAVSTTRPFGVANSLSANITGFVLGQTLATSGVTGSPNCSTTATATSDPGTYPITCIVGTLTSSNYNFANFVDGVLTVTKAGTMFTANPTSIVSVLGLLFPQLTMSGTLKSTATNAGAAGQTINFASNNGGPSCSATTDRNGFASCTVSNGLLSILSPKPNSYTGTFSGSVDYLPSSGSASIH